MPRSWRYGYLLLEVVVATGLLVVGLAVIGAQFHDSTTTIKKMDRRMRAMMLAEHQLAYLDLGLLELDSIDEVQEGDFGPRFPDWGWVMVTEPAAVQGMFRLTLHVMHHIREGEYQEDSFDFDAAETVLTTYAFRAAPQALDLAVEFGLTEEEMVNLSEKLTSSGIPGLDPQSFDPAVLAKLDFEELIEALPLILDALGLELGDLQTLLPPAALEELRNRGALNDGGGEENPEP